MNETLRPICDATPGAANKLADSFLGCAQALDDAAHALRTSDAFPHPRNYPEGGLAAAQVMRGRIAVLKQMAEQFRREADLIEQRHGIC
jgi:hypothetical protein